MILGLTGSIGGGKSTALRAFADAGAAVADADRIVHGCYENPESELLRQLRNRWGEGIFRSDGTVNRRAIAGIVFADRTELDFLTETLRPELDARLDAVFRDAARRPRTLTVVELPLLFEGGWQHRTDATAALWTTPELRRKRLAARGMAPEEIRRREAGQWPDERKLEAADYALVNNGSPELLRMQCNQLFCQLIRSESADIKI